MPCPPMFAQLKSSGFEDFRILVVHGPTGRRRGGGALWVAPPRPHVVDRLGDASRRVGGESGALRGLVCAPIRKCGRARDRLGPSRRGRGYRLIFHTRAGTEFVLEHVVARARSWRVVSPPDVLDPCERRKERLGVPYRAASLRNRPVRPILVQSSTPGVNVRAIVQNHRCLRPARADQMSALSTDLGHTLWNTLARTRRICTCFVPERLLTRAKPP